jgi:spore coat polysaccharide biosynthesis protein SpsF
MVTERQSSNLLIIQARTSSSRLPNKVLKEVNGKPILEWQTKRVLQTTGLDQVVIATSTENSDDEIVEIGKRCGISTIRGSLHNVYSRFIKAVDIYNPEYIIRITGDCPLYMPNLCEAMLKEFKQSEVDYLSNTQPPTYPDGCDVEIVRTSVLRQLQKLTLTKSEIEHVTLGIYKRRDLFTCKNFMNSIDESIHRWTLDTQDDFDFIAQVYREFIGKELTFTYSDVMRLLEQNPKLARYDTGDMRNSGLDKNE